MSRVDDLLNDLTEQELIIRAYDETQEPNIVIGSDRIIEVPDELRKIAVQFDHRIETVTFDCPRYWDGADMSKMKIYVHYTREDGLAGIYLCKNVVVDREFPDIMHFDWTLTRNATGAPGRLTFLVAIKRVDNNGYETQYWNTSLNKEMYVDLGMDNNEIVRDQYPDVFTHMLQRMDETVEETENIKETAKAEMHQIKSNALSEITKSTDTSVSTIRNVKNSALNEVVNARNSGITEITNLKNSTIQEVTNIKNETVDRFNRSIRETSELMNTTQGLMNETQELMNDTQVLMNTTNDLHNETLEWVKEVTDIATPEAMKTYAQQYYMENPTAILDAVDEIYSLASDSDIDNIIAGQFEEEPDAFEEEFSLATNSDIDAILSNTYVETPDEE